MHGLKWVRHARVGRYIRQVVVPAATDYGLAVIRTPRNPERARRCMADIKEKLATPFMYAFSFSIVCAGVMCYQHELAGLP